MNSQWSGSLLASATEWTADASDSMLLVLGRLGVRWSLQRKEPACVVGEHRQLVLVMLGCLWRPACPKLEAPWSSTAAPDTTSILDGGVWTLMSLVVTWSLSMLFNFLHYVPNIKKRYNICCYRPSWWLFQLVR